MDHLRPGIRLLAVVGDRDGIELAHRVVALQDAARVLPRDRRAGLDLGPGDIGVPPAAGGELGNEVVDAAAPLLVARIPVLDRRWEERRVGEGGVRTWRSSVSATQ